MMDREQSMKRETAGSLINVPVTLATAPFPHLPYAFWQVRRSAGVVLLRTALCSLIGRRQFGSSNKPLIATAERR